MVAVSPVILEESNKLGGCLSGAMFLEARVRPYLSYRWDIIPQLSQMKGELEPHEGGGDSRRDENWADAAETIGRPLLGIQSSTTQIMSSFLAFSSTFGNLAN